MHIYWSSYIYIKVLVARVGGTMIEYSLSFVCRRGPGYIEGEMLQHRCEEERK